MSDALSLVAHTFQVLKFKPQCSCENIRSDLKHLEARISGHPYLEALEENCLHPDSLKVFVGQQHHIIGSDLRSIALILARQGMLPSRPFCLIAMAACLKIGNSDIVLLFRESPGGNSAACSSMQLRITRRSRAVNSTAFEKSRGRGLSGISWLSLGFVFSAGCAARSSRPSIRKRKRGRQGFWNSNDGRFIKSLGIDSHEGF
jgi:hypothetical protein